MKTRTCLATDSTPQLDAYCSTGTSPGVTGCLSVSFDPTFGPRTTADVGYEIHGPAWAPPIVVLGGISAGRHLRPTVLSPDPGWWPGVVEPGGALDPLRHRLIGFDFVGGPASRLELGHPISSQDQARVLAGLLDQLDIDRVTLVGASYGGMVALAFAALFPERAIRLAVICAAHRTHPMATALRAIQRRTVRLSNELGRPDAGLSLARSIAMTTYRSAIEFDQRFDASPSVSGGVARFPVESYLEARGDDFATRFDSEGFLRLSESIDLHAVDPEHIQAATTLVSFDTDTLVPPWLVDELAGAAPGIVGHIEIRSHFGHDGFLKEAGLVSEAIRSTLGAEEVTP
jgi:homoserine O-acetyltransferase